MKDDRRIRQGFTIWFTGLSGAGKTTLARLVEAELRAVGRQVEVLDGDMVRAHLSKDLGFSRKDRERNIQRIGSVCEVLSRNGIVAIAAAISPYRKSREEVRKKLGHFIEVYCKCPLDVVIRRDPKGLYRKALAGEIMNFTGISDPYEAPLAADVILETDKETPERCVDKLLGKLKQTRYLGETQEIRTVQ